MGLSESGTGCAGGFFHCFFHWYNHAHRHSGIGLMTPAAVHHGQAQQLYDRRAAVLADAFARTPERFVRRPPTPPELPTAAWINKPDTKEIAHQIPTRSVSPDLTGSAGSFVGARQRRRRCGGLAPLVRYLLRRLLQSGLIPE
ncbi:MAG: hypothetical protein IT345_08955 [Trueperaceae bacterium]|nr:hypothetical protein [Trueperaceae bacterium]